jgi:hypothetical protein
MKSSTASRLGFSQPLLVVYGALILSSAASCVAGGKTDSTVGASAANEPGGTRIGGGGPVFSSSAGSRDDVLGPGVDPNFTGIPTCERCDDFPADPVFEGGLGADTARTFAGSAQPGLCVIEPADGALIPANMLRPRVRFTGGGDVHQITVSTPRERSELVVYTRSNPWTLPAEVWQGLSRNVFEEDITITVRSAAGGTVQQAETHFRVAPVQAGGSMVYWGSTSRQPGVGTSALYAFGVGEEAVIEVLTPGGVTEEMLGDDARLKRPEYDAPEGGTRCIGCHTSTGDGQAVITGDHWPWNLAVSDISGTGGRPTYVSDQGAMLLQMPWLGVSTTSRGDWATGRYRLITSAGPRPAMADAFQAGNEPDRDMGFRTNQNRTGQDQLLWIDLATPGVAPAYPTAAMNQEAQNAARQALGRAMIDAKGSGWGVVARQGDSRGAVTPDWSHDGKWVAYTSTDSTQDGRIGENANNVDVYLVPWNEGAGGAAKPLPGASATGVAEYYPDFSADDRFVAYNRVADGRGNIYYRGDGEIFITRTDGEGSPVRLAANDPPACSGEKSPGVHNSWAKWSPTVRRGPEGTRYAERHYYFVLFSSTRQSPFRVGSDPASQLYLATVVESDDGKVETFPAMYLWNQGFEITNPDADNPTVAPVQTSNLTPAFDEFVIPPRPPVIVR